MLVCYFVIAFSEFVLLKSFVYPSQMEHEMLFKSVGQAIANPRSNSASHVRITTLLEMSCIMNAGGGVLLIMTYRGAHVRHLSMTQ